MGGKIPSGCFRDRKEVQMMEKEKEAIRGEPGSLWNLSYILALVISTVSGFSFYMNQSLLAGYLQGPEIGITAQTAGVIVGLFSLTSLFCRPFCGILADRINNKLLLLISMLLMSAGLTGFAFTKAAAGFFFFRILNGLGFAVSSTVQVAMATRYIPRGKTGEGIGYLGLGNVLGSAVAPGLGIAVSEAMGVRAMLLVSAALPAAACLILPLLGKTASAAKKAARKIRFRDILDPSAFPYSISAGVFAFGNGMINAYIVLFAAARGVESVALYFTVYAICMLLIRPLSGKLMDRKGIRWTVYPGILLTMASFALLAVSTSLPMILASSILRAVGQGSAQPSLQAGCVNYMGRDRAGVATSTYYLFSDVGQGIGPMLGGVIIGSMAGAAGYETLYWLCAGLMLLNLFFIAGFFRKHGIQ